MWRGHILTFADSGVWLDIGIGSRPARPPITRASPVTDVPPRPPNRNSHVRWAPRKPCSLPTRQWKRRYAPPCGNLKAMTVARTWRSSGPSLCRLGQVRTPIDLGGLENATGLHYLSIPTNVASLAPLSTMTELSMLRCGASQDASLHPIEELAKLRYLSVAPSNITDIKPIGRLADLRVLYLDGNRITDAAPLSGLSKLAMLALSRNEVTDLAPFGNLSALRDVRLVGNQIADIAPLAENAELGAGDRIDLRGNPLNQEALEVHIPALKERGVEIEQGRPPVRVRPPLPTTSRPTATRPPVRPAPEPEASPEQSQTTVRKADLIAEAEKSR